jgi:hypothetical protein
MNLRIKIVVLPWIFSLLFVNACAVPANYGLYRENLPRSLLVIPPLNDSIEVNASYIYLSTITRPLAEMGYYVFPVAVVDAFMQDNGLPTPYEMNSISLAKIREVFDADAVLYLHVEDWGQKYQIVSSNTVVKVRARMVDVKSGETLWQGTAEAIESSNGRNNDLLGMVVSAAVAQILDTSSQRVRVLAATANQEMIYNKTNGLLIGPYHPEFASDLRGR